MEKLWQPGYKWFTDGNLKLHYLDWGNPTAMPMVLLHHHTGIARYWDSFAQAFRQEYHVIAVDQRGHGDSHWMESYAHQEYADDLAKFADTLGLDDMVLIGHSLGGINSIIYTASHPDRVAKLVIVDIGPEINIEGTQNFKKRMYNMPETFASGEEAGRHLKQVNPRYSDELIRHLVKYATKRNESGNLIFKYDPALRHFKYPALTYLWQYLDKIVCPTLIVRGAESELLSVEAAQKMLQVLPKGTLADIEHAGHNLPGDNPAAFAAAVRIFLDGNKK